MSFRSPPSMASRFVPWLVWFALAMAGSAQAQPAAPASAASAAPTHRPLRDNQPPPPAPVPTEPEVFRGYAAAPAFTVVPRQQDILLFPCSQCHNLLPLNAQPRKLIASPHQASLRHGAGRMWCLDCHNAKDRQWLHLLNGEKVAFNDSPLVCGQCHGARHRDWSFGAHGKRVAGWQGERELYACTHCHNPHEPALQPRAPSKPPPVRAGLSPMQRATHAEPPPWQRQAPGKPE